ncbi:MAG: Glycosyl transferase group 1 [Microgenomates group bacterium GW2011_GWA2_44_7]|nr:MAG: Glycosyl transferase group 1 [Microgenomates group bacterium GW2011_GWA2_44_7]KKT78400.1 MAG: Glycosyl transferase group 1 [Microgenomates group bacterium GW2011_GWB1_44_8]
MVKKEKANPIKVGFIVSPLETAHATRGIGFYTNRLYTNLCLLTQKKEYRAFKVIPISNFDQLNSEQLSVLHYPFFDLFRPTLKIPKGLSTVITIHDVTQLRFPQHYPAGIRGKQSLMLQTKALQSVKLVITDSYTSKKDITFYLKIASDRIQVIPLAPQFVLNERLFKSRGYQVKKKYKLPDKYVLYVGDVNWNKNIPGLIKACGQMQMPLVIVGKQAIEIDKLDRKVIHVSRPRDILRNLLGLPHPELAHVEELTRLFKSDLVIRLGFVPEPDLPVIYSLANVYCQPSFWEGFGLDPLEAITVGCPVVSSNTPALKELLGNAAVYVDPLNVDDIAQGIQSALNPAVSRRLTALGKARSCAYNWQKTAAMTLDVYNKVLETK